MFSKHLADSISCNLMVINNNSAWNNGFVITLMSNLLTGVVYFNDSSRLKGIFIDLNIW